MPTLRTDTAQSRRAVIIRSVQCGSDGVHDVCIGIGTEMDIIRNVQITILTILVGSHKRIHIGGQAGSVGKVGGAEVLAHPALVANLDGIVNIAVIVGNCRGIRTG